MGWNHGGPDNSDRGGRRWRTGHRGPSPRIEDARYPENVIMELCKTKKRNGLEKFGVDRYEHPIDVLDRVNEAFAEILAASKGTQFETHFMKEEVQEHVKEVT